MVFILNNINKKNQNDRLYRFSYKDIFICYIEVSPLLSSGLEDLCLGQILINPDKRIYTWRFELMTQFQIST